MTNFRFSPAPNQAHRIEWLPWGPEALARAQNENKPVLLSISAVWCYWCHVMDETSYSDPDVQHLLAEDFIAIRTDNDHRPDINSRYNVGGWPTTAFLTAHGGLIGGATYLPPDQFLAMLSELRAAYKEDRPQLYDQAGERLRHYRERIGRNSASEPPEPRLVDRVARRVAGAYDAVNGGFGAEPKFPNAPIVQYLAHLFRTTGEGFYGEMLRKTLDAMCGGPLFDQGDGGFFRNASGCDWSGPQMEKLLEDNVALARAYLDAADLLEQDRFRRVAESAIDYILRNLYDDAAHGFRGSQGANSEYFSLPVRERQLQAPPPVDPSCYVNSNAATVCVLLDSSWRLQRPELLDTALEVLDNMDAAAEAGSLSHVYDGGGPATSPAFLGDWANLLTALIDAHAYTRRPRYLERAGTVAVELLDRFFDHQNGGFFDIERDPDSIGHMRVRDKPLPENVAAAVALLKLEQITGDSNYHQVAETTLSVFTETCHEYGEHAAVYGQAVDLLHNAPVEVTLEGRPEDRETLDMLSAAVRLPCPNLVIKPVAVDDRGYPAQAHVCLDTLCLPPVSDPDSLGPMVMDMLSNQANPFANSPFDNIFDRLPGT